jgi:hypothetical protein
MIADSIDIETKETLTGIRHAKNVGQYRTLLAVKNTA